jgi:hypothetical protein
MKTNPEIQVGSWISLEIQVGSWFGLGGLRTGLWWSRTGLGCFPVYRCYCSALCAELEPELTVWFGGSGFKSGSELNQSNFNSVYGMADHPGQKCYTV